jgi:8-oxo-dGTP pyrophosphatase MutT (NUDIX family)
VLIQGANEPLSLPVASLDDIKVLMVRRKDSMSFMEFVRGKYELSNPEYIERLVSNMTQAEQHKIATLPFQSVWGQLWGNGRDTHSPEFYDAKDKFEQLDREQLVAKHPSPYSEPEWGFPKGRRMRGESDIDCAVREFYEETNIPREAYTLCKNLMFTETFTGTNDVQYTHVYFIALIKDASKIQLTQTFTASQKREVSAVKWKSFSECISTIRPHYTRRLEILEDIQRAITTFETLGI